MQWCTKRRMWPSILIIDYFLRVLRWERVKSQCFATLSSANSKGQSKRLKTDFYIKNTSGSEITVIKDTIPYV